MKFKQFKEQKDREKEYMFLDAVCYTIATSGKTFDECWEEIIPVILKEDFKNTEEMAELILENFGSTLGNLAGRFGRGLANNVASFGQGIGQGWSGQAGQAGQANQAGQQQQPVQAQVVSDPQFNQANVDPIKKDFVKGLQQIQRAISAKHKPSDPQGYKTQVLGQLSQVANQWLQNWSPNMNNIKKADAFTGPMAAWQAGQAQRAAQTQP